MNELYTTDYNEWNKNRVPIRPLGDIGEIFSLAVPEDMRSEFKGFALAPVIIDEDGNTQACQTRILKEGDSIRNYDFSDCYLYTYDIWIQDYVPFDPDTFEPIAGAQSELKTKIRMRFSGTEKRRDGKTELEVDEA